MEPIILDDTLVGEMMKQQDIIAENIPRAAIFEHLAEEAVEVAHAALKCARILRGENPTPLEYEEAKKDLEEEWTDLDLVVDTLNAQTMEHLAIDYDLYREKLNRWHDRIMETFVGDVKDDKKYFVGPIPNRTNDNELYKSSADALRESINRTQEAYFHNSYLDLCKKHNVFDDPEANAKFLEMFENDPVNHPSHYCREGSSIETLDAIEASMTSEEFKGYLKGNAEKYIWRYDLKDNPLQDIKKAIFYLKKLKKVLKKEK